jgi:hypothetical protein
MSALTALTAWLDGQEEWSDLPFVLLTFRGDGLERNPAATRYLETLGNVTLLERPFHPTTLVSLARVNQHRTRTLAPTAITHMTLLANS